METTQILVIISLSCLLISLVSSLFPKIPIIVRNAFFLVAIILLATSRIVKQEDFEQKSEITHHITKKTIRLPHLNTRWKKDFVERWKNHEYKTNKKLIELMRDAPNNAIVIDSGAHVGDTGIMLAQILRDNNKSCRIMEIDPHRGKIDFIKELTILNDLRDHVMIYNCGLGSSSGKGTLDKSSHAGGWSITKSNDGNSEFDIKKLDDIVRDKVYLIKLDVEGMEIEALRGALNIIQRDSPLLMVEIIEHQLKKYNTSQNEIYKFMKSLGYEKTWAGDNDVLFSPDPGKDWLYHYFDRVVTITIPKRLEHVKKFTEKLNSKNIIHNAIWKDTLSFPDLIKQGLIVKNHPKSMSKGRVACHLSHIQVLRDFLNSNAETCLIFEDDNSLDFSNSKINFALAQSLKYLPEDWDILNLSPCWADCKNRVHLGGNLYKYTTSVACRNAYAVTRKGAKITIEKSLPLGKLSDAGDDTIAELTSQGILKYYSIHPRLFNQNREGLGTTLGNNDKLLECY